MKIARIIARLNVGGPAIQAVLLTRLLREQGHETALLTGAVPAGEASAEAWARGAGVEFIRIPGLSRKVSPLDDVRALAAIRRELRRLRPDIVHTHTAKAGTLGRVAAFSLGIPAVHTFHGHVFEGYFAPAKTRLVIAAERLLASRTRVIIAISPRQKRDLTERFHVAPADKVRIVRLGFELAPFAAAYAARAPRPRDFVPRIGWVGRLTAIKDPLLFARIASCHLHGRTGTEAQFVQIGAGEMRTAIEDEAARLGLGPERFRLAGLQQDMPAAYRELDAVMLTSHNEGTPVAVIEAMAAGCAAIAAEVGGVADLMGDVVETGDGFTVCRHGVLVRERRPEVYCAALEWLYAHPEAWDEMAVTAHEYAIGQFCHKRLADEVLEVYRQVLDLPAPAAAGAPTEVLP